MNVNTVLSIFSSHGLNLNKPESVLEALKLLENFRAAKDFQTRNKIIKTVLRTVLPFPISMAAGELLVRLRKLIKPLDKVIKEGL